MGEVNITINDRSFRLGCDDGEEEHLLVLADHLAQHVENLRKTMAKAGDEQLYLMAGLMVCDELWDAREQLVTSRKRLKKLEAAKEREEEMSAVVREADPAVPDIPPVADAPPPRTEPSGDVRPSPSPRLPANRSAKKLDTKPAAGPAPKPVAAPAGLSPAAAPSPLPSALRSPASPSVNPQMDNRSGKT